MVLPEVSMREFVAADTSIVHARLLRRAGQFEGHDIFIAETPGGRMCIVAHCLAWERAGQDVAPPDDEGLWVWGYMATIPDGAEPDEYARQMIAGAARYAAHFIHSETATLQ
jgi:hypothetical protein